MRPMHVRWARIGLVIAGLLAVWFGAFVFAMSGDDSPVQPRPTPTTAVMFRDATNRFAVTYPRDWTRAETNLTPRLASPKEILSIGTYPLRPGGSNCAQVPVNALEDLGPADAFFTIEETSN